MKTKKIFQKQVVKFSIYTFLILVALQAILYFIFLKKIPDFLNNYATWFIYLDISIAMIATGLWHILSYKKRVTCMVGMMLGMTIGMQTGMMIGSVLGATNGFFVGAMTGMLLGVATGIIAGKCCGVMGVMEGMMAGLMGGTMGPMISVMMFSDNLSIFMPFYMIINIAIVVAMSHMLYKELEEGKEEQKITSDNFTAIAAYAIIFGIILMAIMLYGPKSSFIGF